MTPAIASQRLTACYELLGVPPDADAAVLTAAFARQYRVWPARLRLPYRPDRAYAAWVLRVLGDAEPVLRDPDRRRDADAVRAQGPRGQYHHRDFDASYPWRPAAPATAVGWHDRAHHQLDGGDPAGAHRLAREAAWHSPDSAVAWLVRGYASALLRRFADAEHELAEAAGLAPAEALPRYLLGEVRAAQDRWRPALAAYDQALALDPDNPPMVAAKADALIAMDRDHEAVALLEPVVARHPGDDAYSIPLACAYHDAAASRLTRVPGTGGGIWTSPEQIAALTKAAERIDALHCGGPEAARLAQSLRDFAGKGLRVRWDTAAPTLYFWFGGFLFLWGCGVGVGTTGSAGAGLMLGLLVAAGVAGGLFTLLRRKPAWKLAAESIGEGNLSHRLMAATNRATAAVFRVLDP